MLARAVAWYPGWSQLLPGMHRARLRVPSTEVLHRCMVVTAGRRGVMKLLQLERGMEDLIMLL
jgi:hypothetical protein